MSFMSLAGIGYRQQQMLCAAAAGGTIALAAVALWDRAAAVRAAAAQPAKTSCTASKSVTVSATQPSSERASLPPASRGSPEEAAVEIEYCVGCRWMLRATWLMQELLSTFSTPSEQGEAPTIRRITLVPNAEKPGGVFRVRVNGEEVWDRKTQGGFPESKVLKQLVRDRLTPGKDLGHSDKKG
eukprot:TRINITY_DN23689_c0_g1_i1.p1 TRINITY_DN23689_c0_g1~~TRINITY_DN23689_c0_g1_i1.p1  ORF type:complete len:207 (+),score=27.90 TRINITY_DN23689_c0_g1_i1:70-621(+)